MLILHNPLPILSLNLLGLGLDLTYGVAREDEKNIASLTLCVNFVFGQYLKHWNLNG